MSDVPWTITSSKRKSNKRTTSPRKRTKRTSDATTTNQDSTVSRPQQTLTQIAFVSHSSFDDEEPSINFEPLATEAPEPTIDKPSRILKRDLTLTQMDFGGSFGSSRKRRSSATRPPGRNTRKKSKKRDSTLTQMDFFNASMDGTADFDETMLSSPKLATPKRTVPSDQLSSAIALFTPSKQDVKEAIPFPEMQDYRPGKRKRKGDQEQLDSCKRRRSSRIAAATPAPVTSADVVHAEAIQPASARRCAPAIAPRRPLLEIQDSTDFLEESVSNDALAQSRAMIPPSTPTKNIGRIPSSQTPESIRRDTPRRALSPTKDHSRQPLAELSSNLRMPGQKFAQRKPRMIDVLGNDASKKSPPRRVCTLKVSGKALRSIDQAGSSEVPERDVYSIQATSSPSRRGSSPRKEVSNMSSLAKQVSNSSGGPTIKETASSQRRFETQDSLPDINDVLNISHIAAIDGADESQPKDPITPTKAQQYLEVGKQDKMVDANQVLLNQGPMNMIPELEQVSIDELSEFGSPVANDTQFIRSLYERLSSPVATTISNIGSSRAATVPRTHHRSPVHTRGLSRVSLPGSPPKRSPLPAPKLVQTSPVRIALPMTTASSSLRALPSSSTQTRSLENVQISFVPLNDTAEYQRSSSSPALPPAPLPSAPEGTHLASIPHPSQVSTQAPSQGYFPTSSAPQTFPFPHDSEVERITVKDSSSYPACLSQMLQHVDDDSVSEGDLNLLDDLEDEDDLDLDPSTLPTNTSRSKKGIALNNKSDEEDITQTPTQKSRRHKNPTQKSPSTQSSPIITNATTRSQRNAKLEVIPLTSSSSPTRYQYQPDNYTTPRPHKSPAQKGKSKVNTQPHSSPPSSSLPSTTYSPSPPRDLKRKYTPIPGFNNDTQSDFTQGGSVTAAYVHRMWNRGDLPRSFVPKPYKVKNVRPGMRGVSGGATGSKKAKTK